MSRHAAVGVRQTVAVAAAICLAGLSAAGESVSAQLQSAATTTRISVSSAEAQANDSSGQSGISANRRYVVFLSGASNLVPGDTNGAADVFVRDRSNGTTVRASVGTNGAQANDSSISPVITAKGRVAFVSHASNLVAGDTNGADDVFIRNLSTGSTRRVSLGPDAAQANNDSSNPGISADGRYVVFVSQASNLVSGDTNHRLDVFVRDLSSQVTKRVSVGAHGAQARGPSHGAPALSADGRYVAFASSASNLVRRDTNDKSDVFVRDLGSHVTRRVSVGAHGAQGNRMSYDPALSANGRFVVFGSRASNLVAADTNKRRDVFVRNLLTGVTRRASVGPGGVQANGRSFHPAISADGRYVAFDSEASNLVARDTRGWSDVFVRDRSAHQTRRVSVGRGGTQANRDSSDPTLSANGREVAFDSYASNLVAADSNGFADAFVRTLPR